MIISDFISSDLQTKLLKWIQDSADNLISVDQYRKCLRLNGYQGFISSDVCELKNAIIDRMNLKEYEDSDRTKNVFFNCFSQNAQLHRHKHYPVKGLCDLRCNVLLSGDLDDGLPVVENYVFKVRERDLWVFNANLEHWSEPVKSNKNRIALSFGFLVPENHRILTEGTT